MTFLCWGAALVLSILLGFVSYVQLLYLESLRLLRRETPALEHFREELSAAIKLDSERGSLSFSLIKHISLPLVGVFFLCAVTRPEAPPWQRVLEASGLALASMFLMTYVAPQVLYRRTTGLWMRGFIPLIRLLAIVIGPVSMLLGLFHSVLDYRENGNGEPEKTPHPSEHVEALIDAGAEEGILEEEDRELIHSVVAFGDKTVREVMTARPNIVAISAEKSLADLRQLVIHEQYSRIPVYKETIDNIIGFVHVRDMFELDENERQQKRLSELLRPIRVVPETKPVHDLLREMQHDSAHMVIVVDEYGNTAGLATMEDLVEEILGEIRDEHEPDRDVCQESETSFVAPGSLDLDRLHELLGFRPEQDTESTTVGGLVAEWLGHVPQVAESVERDGIRIEVLAGNELRVEQVRVSKLEAEAPV